MAANAPVDERFYLRVRNLPAVLSTDAITSLLSHYGATRVRVLQRRNAVSSGKEPGAAPSKKLQKAVATFASREAQQNAQRRLHSLELAGHHLQVEVVGDDAATTSPQAKPGATELGNKLPLNGQPPLPKGLPPPLPPTPPPEQNPLCAPAPLAPHLGLHYAPSPLLEYKYPKATESIVRNIANALIALPRFYTQVLHLMNKMNLPPPFEEDAIPGRFSLKLEQDAEIVDEQKRHPKRRRTDEIPIAQIVEEEEDEDDDDDTHPVADMDHSNIQHVEVSKPLQSNGKGIEPLSLKAGRNLSDLPEDNSRPPVILLGRQSKLSSIKKSATLGGAFQVGAQNENKHEAHQSTRPGVISKTELERQRLAPEDILKEPLMVSYSRGSVSVNVLVENVARSVDKKDLRSVFGYVLPIDMALDSMKIAHDEAKHIATITYPDEDLATAAVDALHGVQLEGKTLLVSFLTPPSEVIFSVKRWSLQELASNRLPEEQLGSEKVMKRYQRGEPSDTLYVKNIAKTVELADLMAVFGAVLPSESGPEVLKIRHFTEGRMKCQAFVTYPTVELASCALKEVHGVVLKDKPLIVCFRKPQTN